MSGDIALYLRDILESIKLLKKYTKGIEEAEFNKDFKLQDAVTRRLEIVGEAVNYPIFVKIRPRKSAESTKGNDLESAAKRYEEGKDKKEKDAESFL